MFRFKNLDISPATLAVPKWQTETIDRIEASPEVQHQAAEVSVAFEKSVLIALANAKTGYKGVAVLQAIRNAQRYMWLKNVTAPDGKEYDAEIDLLAHTVRFCEI